MPIIRYKRYVFAINELLCLTVTVQNCMEIFVRVWRIVSKWGGGLGFVFRPGMKIRYLLKYVGLLSPKLALYVL